MRRVLTALLILLLAGFAGCLNIATAPPAPAANGTPGVAVQNITNFLEVTNVVAVGVSDAKVWPDDREAHVGLSREEERGRWRVSVGASVIGPVRSDIDVDGAQARWLSGFGASLARRAAAQRGGRTREEAFAEGSGATHGGVRKFDGGAWFDPVDSGAENDPEFSWNWRLHDPSAADHANHGKAFVERTAYDEVSETVSVTEEESASSLGIDGPEWFPGLRAEVAYDLYRSDGERPWGVEIASAFAYYFQRGLWKANGEIASASVRGGRNKGYYEWWNDSHGEAQYILDYYRDTQFRDGMWGAGSFEGPGAELAVDSWRFRDVPEDATSWSSSHTLRYRGDGDYREYSIELLARPWWEPWKWLRLFGSLGVEISRREFKWSLSASGTDGTSFSEHGEACDWRALGLLGGGLAMQWYDFILAGEALWRFGGDDLAVSGQTVNGSVKSGDWGFRLSLGHEF